MGWGGKCVLVRKMELPEVRHENGFKVLYGFARKIFVWIQQRGLVVR